MGVETSSRCVCVCPGVFVVCLECGTDKDALSGVQLGQGREPEEAGGEEEERPQEGRRRRRRAHVEDGHEGWCRHPARPFLGARQEVDAVNASRASLQPPGSLFCWPRTLTWGEVSAVPHVRINAINRALTVQGIAQRTTWAGARALPPCLRNFCRGDILVRVSPGFQFSVRQVRHHLAEGTAAHRLRPPPPARIDENPSTDPGSD